MMACALFCFCPSVAALSAPASDDLTARIFAIGDARQALHDANWLPRPDNSRPASNDAPLFPSFTLADVGPSAIALPAPAPASTAPGAPPNSTPPLVPAPSAPSLPAVAPLPASAVLPATLTTGSPSTTPEQVPALNLGVQDGEQPFPLPRSPLGTEAFMSTVQDPNGATNVSPVGSTSLSPPDGRMSTAPVLAIAQSLPIASSSDAPAGETVTNPAMGAPDATPATPATPATAADTTRTGRSGPAASTDGVVLAPSTDAVAPTSPPSVPSAPVVPEWTADHDRAVALARSGHNDQAAIMLRKIHKAHPEDISVARDYVFALQWSDQHEAAISQFRKLPKGDEPDYVLEAVGHAYRDVHRPAQALKIYQRGLTQSPNNEVFGAGLVRCLSELGRPSEGLPLGEENLKRYGNRLDVLLATAEAAYLLKRDYEALRDYELALQIEPNNREGLHGFIILISQMGAAPLAHHEADQHPYVLSDTEYRQILGDEAALYVRWGPVEPISEAERFKATDRAIDLLDKLIDDWSIIGSAAQDNINRARFDRIVALRDRSRMREVVDEYDNLQQNHIEIPNYALASVGDAYLYLRHPEQARDIYLLILQSDAKNFDVRRQLYFAYVECDDFDDAYTTIDQLDAEQPIWIWLKGQTEPLPNDNKAITLLDAANARLYGDELEDAYGRIAGMVDAAPYAAKNQASLANVDAARGWPRAAQEHYRLALQMHDVADVDSETGVATTDLDLQHFAQTDTETSELLQRFPENLDVQRADRQWQVHNMAELDVSANYAFRPTNSAVGGEGYGLETRIYSSPINYNWRVFAGEFFTHEDEPNEEGSVSLSRSIAGVEYRQANVTADLAPTFNHYNGTQRVGGAGDVSYDLSDNWKLGATGELLSRDTPLRALNVGTTADLVSANITWRQSESRDVTVTAIYMPFSDNNIRSSVNGTYTERLYTDPYFSLEGYVDLGSSHDTYDNNRDYFNPKQDGSGSIGVVATQPLYRREERLWEHSLKIGPGVYWEQGYGVSDAGSLTYEQRLRYDDTLDGNVAVSAAHQSYDGRSENDIGVTMNLVKRF